MLKIYKKWDNKPGTLITLAKNDSGATWTLTIDSESRILHCYKDLLVALSRYRQFESIDDVGGFLGFNIFEKRNSDYSYTKFLQTNPLDNDSFLERKEKVMSVYSRVENNYVEKK